MKTVNDEIINNLRKTEVEILDEFVRICKKYNLTYFLGGGTLLGAVRHKGFIPWDDDIDVSMFRKDYDRFIEVAPKELGDKYYLDSFETNKDYYLPFAKIKKNGTIFDEERSSHVKHHKGIFVDIFPLENVNKPNKLDKLRTLFIRTIVDTVFFKLKMRTLGELKHPLLVLVLNIFSKNFLMVIQRKLLTMNKDDNSKYVCALSGSYAYEKEITLRSSFIPVKEVTFEGKKYNGMNNNDIYLTNLYGDYMKLPPKEKRVNHMPKRIVFDTSINE